MNFPNVIESACIPTEPPAPDNRCSDPAFALLHPEICANAIALRLKPGVAIVCVLGSVQLEAFSFVNGVETLLTSGVVFTVSNKSVALIGVNSGNLTGVGQGTVTVTATYQGITATAAITVLPGLNCCDDLSVATMLVLDKSKSMTLDFGSGYASKQAFADAVASAYAQQTNTQKDTIGLITFNDVTTVDEALTSNAAQVASEAAAVLSTQALTTLESAIGAATESLLASGADFKVMVIISDGEDHPTNPADFDPSAIANYFKTAGGIIICVGVRAHGTGFNLLSVLSTGGFFVNAYPAVVDEAIQAVYALKGYTCAGNCAPPGNIYQNEGALDYTDFTNWTVTQGHVDLFAPDLFDLLPGNGSYVSMVSNISPYKGELTSISSFTFTAGKTYRISFDLAGNQRMDLGTQNVTVKVGDGTVFSQIVSLSDYTQPFTKFSYNFTPQVTVTAQLIFTELGNNNLGSYFGCLLDNIAIEDITDLTTLFTENFDSENLQYVPPACGVGVTGSAGGSDDPDVLAFIAATGISNTTQINAVRKFVLTLKANSLWTKFDALYPFMGSSAAEHSYNLKNPSLYQITWNGIVTHGLNSITGDGATGYGNTGFNPTVAAGHFSTNSASIGVYCRTNSGNAGGFMGNINSFGAGSALGPDGVGGVLCPVNVSGSSSTISTTSSLYEGIFITSRTNGTDFDAYIPDNTQNVGDGASLSNAQFFILAYSNSGTPNAHATQTLAFAFIASGLSSGEVAILKGAINSLIALQGTPLSGGYFYYYGYNCYGYGCSSEPPGVQLNDPFPLPDIEIGFVPPTTYTSTRSYTAKCPTGTSQIGPASSVPVMTSATAPSGTVTTDNETSGFEAWRAFGTGPAWVSTLSPAYIQYHFVTPITAVAFAVTPYGGSGSQSNPQPVIIQPVGPANGYGASFGSVVFYDLIVGQTYRWTPGINENLLTNGSQIYDHAVTFIAESPMAIVDGQNNGPTTLYTGTLEFLYVFSPMLNKPVQLSLKGSNDGMSFTELGNYQTSFSTIDRRQFDIPAGNVPFSALDIGPYAYYRLVVRVSGDNGSTFTAPAGITLFELLTATANGAGITKSATETSQISQSDADSKATLSAQAEAASALAITGCVTVYTSTQSVTVKCAIGSLGPDVTASATEQSTISQQYADNVATQSAQAAAEALRICNGSDNTVGFFAFSTNAAPQIARTSTSDWVHGGVSQSDPAHYPTVKYISGQTGVITRIRVTLKSYAAEGPASGKFLLMAPNGKMVSLMFKAGGTAAILLPNAIDLIFDSNSVTPLPTPPVAGSYAPTSVGDPNSVPWVLPAPQSGYLTSFATLIGDSPNGSWSLWLVSLSPDVLTRQTSVILGWDITVDSA